MLWLTPAMIVGLASGIWIFHNRCHVVEPNASVASIKSFGTCSIPNIVKRIVGGIEKITDATTPGTTPILKKKIAGSK